MFAPICCPTCKGHNIQWQAHLLVKAPILGMDIDGKIALGAVPEDDDGNRLAEDVVNGSESLWCNDCALAFGHKYEYDYEPEVGGICLFSN